MTESSVVVGDCAIEDAPLREKNWPSMADTVDKPVTKTTVLNSSTTSSSSGGTSGGGEPGDGQEAVAEESAWQTARAEGGAFGRVV